MFFFFIFSNPMFFIFSIEHSWGVMVVTLEFIILLSLTLICAYYCHKHLAIAIVGYAAAMVVIIYFL